MNTWGGGGLGDWRLAIGDWRDVVRLAATLARPSIEVHTKLKTRRPELAEALRRIGDAGPRPLTGVDTMHNAPGKFRRWVKRQ